MRKDKFDKLDYYLQNYIVDIENGDITSNKTGKSIVSLTKRGNKIVKLYNNGVSAYTLADIVAYSSGLLNKDNYYLNVNLIDKDKNNCGIGNIELINLSTQNKINNVGNNLQEHWKNTTYENRDRVYELKYEYNLREKIYNFSKKISNAEVGRKLNIPKCTVGRIIKEFKISDSPIEMARLIDEKLTEQDKQTILKLDAPLKDLSNYYRVPKKIIKLIKNGEMW